MLLSVDNIGDIYTWSLHAFFMIGLLSDPEKTRCKCPPKRIRIRSPLQEVVWAKITDETGQV